MLEMPSFVMNTRPETFVLLDLCIIDDTLSQAMSDAASVHRRYELDECRNCISVHASTPKEDILHLI